MDSETFLANRIKPLNNIRCTYTPNCVMYVVSRDVRITDNFGLIAAQNKAIEHQLPLVVAFLIYEKPVKNRAREHVQFLLEAVADMFASLKKYGISSVILPCINLCDGIKKVEDTYKPLAIFHDQNPLRGPRLGQMQSAVNAQTAHYVVDSHNIIPVWVTSDKQEYAARTIRPKIHKLLQDYLFSTHSLQRLHKKSSIDVVATDIPKIESIIATYPKNNSNVSRFVPSSTGALKALSDFIAKRLEGYAAKRNDPSRDGLSNLSPYLHFGLLSSLQVVLAVKQAQQGNELLKTDTDTLIEEIVVRKELSDNYCYYNNNYDLLVGAPDWAQKTLARHSGDDREFLYTYEQFESAQTHDPAWNAAQLELTKIGKMHGYMRMYWAKKVLEWTPSPQDAIDYLIQLNDFYSMDGYDPNGYTGIMWSVAGVHDRPWGERQVYGTVRSMIYDGLKRKFDIKKYIDKYSI